MLHLNDQPQRDVIARELDRNLVVLAGAGAGKTYALVQRMVSVVRAGEAEVERMVAITFTRKAAGEMRARFNLKLQEAARKAAGAEADRLHRALERSDQCFIGTIHAFCGRLLRERPLDARLSPDFQEIDEREEAELRRAAWDRYVLEAYRDEDPIFDVLEEVGLETEDLYAFYEARCRLHDLPLKPTPREVPDLDGAVEAAQKLLARTDAFCGEIQSNPDPFYTMREDARRFVQNRGLDDLACRAQFLQIVGGKNKVQYTKWGKQNKEWKAQAKQLRDEWLPALMDVHVEPALEAWRNYAYARVAPWVEGAVDAFRERREEAGRLGFADLLGRAADLLRESMAARRFFQQRYTHLFVDEFQDTDPVQAQVLFFLTGTDAQERDWRRLTPRAGSLFIVGDGKQSIYRFRRADVELFREVCDLVERAGGRTLTLTSSFRSLGSLCDWINRAFEPLFGEDRQQAEHVQAPFAPLVNVRPEGSDGHGVRKISIQREKGDYANDIREKEAERVAACIEQCLAGHSSLNGAGDDAPVDEQAEPGDFMILTRRTASLAPFARALERRGIPYDVVGGEALTDVVTVRALLALLEVAHAPGNPVHYLAYLRGPLVGLSDGELLALREAGGRFSFEEAVPDGLDAPLRERLEAARRQVEQAARWLADLTPSAAVERVVEELGLAAFHVYEEGGTTRAGSLARLAAMVRAWEADGWHWGRMLEELRALRDEPGYKQDGMTLDAGRDDVVRLMNLHQVKGLQARVVFLADCYDTSGDGRAPSWHVARTAEEPYAAIPVQRSNGPYHMETIAEPTGWPDDQAREEAFLEAEKLRLVYVGATRAENMLVVTCCPAKSDRGPWRRLFTALEDVPELSPEPVGEARPSDDGAAPELPELEAVRRERERRLCEARRPGYHLRRASDHAHDADELEAAAPHGEGAAYGTLVHQVLEELVDGRLPGEEEALVMHRGRREELSDAQCEQVLGVLEQFRNSELYEQVRAADVVYTEVPFALTEEPGGDGAALVDLWRGLIDLAFRDDAGWHLVDYKTDLASADHPQAEAYFEQVRRYARFWTELTGEPVARQLLYSTVAHDVIEVPA